MADWNNSDRGGSRGGYGGDRPRRDGGSGGPRRDFGGGGRRNFGGGGRGNFGGGRGGFNRGPREMHKAVCAECGQECEVPFKPSGDKPVYCKDCFAKRREQQQF